MHVIIIDENEHSSDIQMTMDTLNTRITNDAEKMFILGRAITG